MNLSKKKEKFGGEGKDRRGLETQLWAAVQAEWNQKEHAIKTNLLTNLHGDRAAPAHTRYPAAGADKGYLAAGAGRGDLPASDSQAGSPMLAATFPTHHPPTMLDKNAARRTKRRQRKGGREGREADKRKSRKKKKGASVHRRRPAQRIESSTARGAADTPAATCDSDAGRQAGTQARTQRCLPTYLHAAPSPQSAPAPERHRRRYMSPHASEAPTSTSRKDRDAKDGAG
ncbi:hypothetical protein DFH09DRAFT_1287826 [Mycena vulgaris]|nr:hypothetical protein DFH09DRAFT_1287826 [Mycena vulgaris]